MEQAEAAKAQPEKMTEYFIFLSACMGLTLSLIGLWESELIKLGKVLANTQQL
jgi:hypothetical protein